MQPTVTKPLNFITRCIYIDNGMKVIKDSGCSLIEYDIYSLRKVNLKKRK